MSRSYLCERLMTATRGDNMDMSGRLCALDLANYRINSKDAVALENTQLSLTREIRKVCEFIQSAIKEYPTVGYYIKGKIVDEWNLEFEYLKQLHEIVITQCPLNLRQARALQPYLNETLSAIYGCRLKIFSIDNLCCKYHPNKEFYTKVIKDALIYIHTLTYSLEFGLAVHQRTNKLRDDGFPQMAADFKKLYRKA